MGRKLGLLTYIPNIGIVGLWSEYYNYWLIVHILVLLTYRPNISIIEVAQVLLLTYSPHTSVIDL